MESWRCLLSLQENLLQKAQDDWPSLSATSLNPLQIYSISLPAAPGQWMSTVIYELGNFCWPGSPLTGPCSTGSPHWWGWNFLAIVLVLEILTLSFLLSVFSWMADLRCSLKILPFSQSTNFILHGCLPNKPPASLIPPYCLLLRGPELTQMHISMHSNDWVNPDFYSLDATWIRQAMNLYTILSTLIVTSWKIMADHKTLCQHNYY